MHEEHFYQVVPGIVAPYLSRLNTLSYLPFILN